MSTGHLVRRGEGELRDLGIVSMRVLADGKASDGLLSVLEFRGGSGPWTVPHAHNHTEETFYVLDGTFDFLCGRQTVTLGAGDYLLVPRGTPHMITAHPPGGTLLGINAPAGLEEMFRELSQMPANSIRDPHARRELAERYDATPVSPSHRPANRGDNTRTRSVLDVLAGAYGPARARRDVRRTNVV